MFQQVLGGGKGLEKLAVQIRAVSHHHQGGIVHLRLLQQFARIAGHGDALARTLGVPHHPRLARAGQHFVSIACPILSLPVLRGLRGDHRCPHRLTHSMKLVIGGDLLDEMITVLLEQHKVADIIQEQFPIEKTPHYLFQLVFQQRLVVLVLESAPGHEAFLAGGQGADTRRDAIGNYQCLVEHEQVWNFFLIGLDLIVGIPHIGIFIRRILEFDHRHGQAIDKYHHIRAAVHLAAKQRELIDHQKLVVVRALEIDELDVIGLFLVTLIELHLDAIDQQSMKGAVVLNQGGMIRLADNMCRFFQGRPGNLRIDALQGIQQTTCQHHLPVI